MSGPRLHGVALGSLVLLWALTLLPGLGSSSRLTYHEALVAQGAREMLATGKWSYPTIGGLPWLEKPPLPWWLVAVLGHWTGGINEVVARLPSALAAFGLVVAVSVLGARHYGLSTGLLAGAIQTTTAWTVIRGRLAEADVLLACLVTWVMLALDRLSCVSPAAAIRANEVKTVHRSYSARWAFFILLGSSALVKGIGFGAMLIALIAVVVVVWQRDRALVRHLWFPPGWCAAAILGLSWPLAMVVRHGPEAISLWTTHFADRLLRHQGHGAFASEPWWEYVPSVVAQALPWSPLALIGAWHSLKRATARYDLADPVFDRSSRVSGAVDRMLWAWSAGPLVLLSLAAVRNAHYAVCAQVPWSVWAALELERLGKMFCGRGWDATRLRRATKGAFAILALAYGLGFWLFGPWFDRRGVEWAFYESASRRVQPNEPLALLYDDWDRNAYDGALGALPHDLAVRLFYLGRPACWHASAISLTAHAGTPNTGQHRAQPMRFHWGGFACRPAADVGQTMSVIGRDRDVPALARIGRVETLARGPALRRDRTYTLFRVTLQQSTPDRPLPMARSGTSSRPFD